MTNAIASYVRVVIDPAKIDSRVKNSEFFNFARLNFKVLLGSIKPTFALQDSKCDYTLENVSYNYIRTSRYCFTLF